MNIGTIFVTMMENRSFDHLLGYLALEGHGVDGIRSDPAWESKVANVYKKLKPFPPFELTDPYHKLEADPPHSRDDIRTQLGPETAGVHAMNGFVTSYANAKDAKPIVAASKPPVMGWFRGANAPVTDFLARNFAICDRWHAALPAGTQPNRLMAMSGTTRIDTNKVPLPSQPLVYDWLTRRGVRWRVYHAGIPFFALMLDRIDDILSGRFRPFSHFEADVMREPPDVFPQVVFIEPVYSDAPHLGPACDDHAPAGIKAGQGFLLQTYRALTRSPTLWNQSVMVVTYDEHGGFFDHLSPPAVRTAPPGDAFWNTPFETLGVRVPAFVVSPFVKPGSVHHGLMDHTSILKFIGERFGNGRGYSAEVDARPVGSVGDLLIDPGATRKAPVIPSLKPYLDAQADDAGRRPGTTPQTPIQQNFSDALNTIRAHPVRPIGVYDDLLAGFPAG